MIQENEAWHIKGAKLMNEWSLNHLPGRLNISSLEKCSGTQLML